MKRRYKTGDWLRVPLGGGHDALAVITRACGSRLFGYFFSVPASHVPAQDELRSRTPEDALAAMLFGGAAIERGRWRTIATSLAFDGAAWPFPDFASRGAFGDAWMRVRYDPETLQIVERRHVDRQAAAQLPDARFADADEAEALLRRAIAGEPPPDAHSICEVRSPIDMERLRALQRGGRLQFSTPLSGADLSVLAQFFQLHPHVTLRVHGFRHGFDAVSLERLTGLRRLTLDVHCLQHGEALRALRAVEELRAGALRISLEFIEAMPSLRTLELRGTRARLEPVLRTPHLESLLLESTAAIDVGALASASALRAIVLSHGEYDLRGFGALMRLRRLELRSLDIRQLPDFRSLPSLEDVALHRLTNVTDLRALADAPALRSLRVSGMPHLNVRDFEPLQQCAGLRVSVDVGSRRKEREIHRLIKRGNTYEL